MANDSLKLTIDSAITAAISKAISDGMKDGSKQGGGNNSDFIGLLKGGAAISAASFAVGIGATALGLDKVGKAFSNYFNPEIYTSKNTEASTSPAEYLAGKYAFNLTVNMPTKDDLKAIDDWYTYEGVTVNEFDTPDIYVENNRSNKLWAVCKTSNANVTCDNLFAKTQMQEMLNNGIKWLKV